MATSSARKLPVWILPVGILVGILLALLFLLLIIQVIPYGRDHLNPPVVAEPAWDSAETRALAQRACFDCHSNETVWPWYSNIAPVSWLLARDVEEGRARLNLSEWGVSAEAEPGAEHEEEGTEIDEIIAEIEEGNMPPAMYLPLHRGAKLSAEENEALINGLRHSLNP